MSYSNQKAERKSWANFENFPTASNLSVALHSQRDFEKWQTAAMMKFETVAALHLKSNPKAFYSYMNSKRKIKAAISGIKYGDGNTLFNAEDIANELGNLFESTFVSETLACQPFSNCSCRNSKMCHVCTSYSDNSYTINYPTASLTEEYKNTLNSDIIEASTRGICCFTDGSKTEHGTGGGFVISDTSTETITEHSFKMKDYCTVFQAETAAIKHAAEELITFKNKQITFWSDSLSALQALSNKTHNNKSITDCNKALTKLADENTVKINWIKARTGHWGNERQTSLPKLEQ